MHSTVDGQLRGFQCLAISVTAVNMPVSLNKKAWKDKAGDSSISQHSFIGEKKPVEGVSSKRARAQCHLQAGGSYRGITGKCRKPARPRKFL
jgi:hypothetical protein